MSLYSEMKRSVGDLGVHVDELRALLNEHKIDGLFSLLRAYRGTPVFRARWNEVWAAVLKDNGGKLSLTTVGAVIGLALGGVGVAALGGAIGLPLALLLGLGGLVAGTEVDDNRRPKN